ncbi:MAG: hypothetical protein H6854_04305 [Rhodospirillales bacterium]|nr:hypothetical protein [Rhodospirillales bacterium]
MPRPSVAQQETTLKPTPSHVLGYIFHKLSNTAPDFDLWVRIYKKAMPQGLDAEQQLNYTNHLKQKFIREFTEFNPEEASPITMVFPAIMKASAFETRELLEIQFKGEYQYLIREIPGYPLNIIIPDLEDRLSPLIDKEEYKNIVKASGGQTFEYFQPIQLVLKLAPVSADAHKPFVIDGKDYWLLLFNFITFEIWDERGVYKIWSFVSEEEKKKNLNELRSLYQEPEETPKNNNIYMDF